MASLRAGEKRVLEAIRRGADEKSLAERTGAGKSQAVSALVGLFRKKVRFCRKERVIGDLRRQWEREEGADQRVG